MALPGPPPQEACPVLKKKFGDKLDNASDDHVSNILREARGTTLPPSNVKSLTWTLVNLEMQSETCK